ncbi:hypothetical protein ACMFMG_004072 [Clarireedia jacksonii]
MPPIPASPTPRIVVYYQTLHHPDGRSISILPLITQPRIAVTHVIIAALHINDPPGNITLNDHSPSHPRHQTVWAELRILQASGIKVLGMLGGAAKGSYKRFDTLNEASFEAYYIPLRNVIRERGLDGLDLDVEERMSLEGIGRLITRLKADFGPEFIITLAPVASALLSEWPEHNLSEFPYDMLEIEHGEKIAWYNTQFYCGWGDISTTRGYDFLMMKGWPAEKIVVGLVTNPGNGSGFVDFSLLQEVLLTLKNKYPGFGGVMGWEYFNSFPGDKDRPWEWAAFMTRILRGGNVNALPAGSELEEKQKPVISRDIDENIAGEATVPGEFEYFTEGQLDEDE